MRAVLIAIFVSLLCGRACAHFTPPTPWTDDARAFTTQQGAAAHQVTVGVTFLSSFAYGYDDANNRTAKGVVTTAGGGALTAESHAYVYGAAANGRNSNQLSTWTPRYQAPAW